MSSNKTAMTDASVAAYLEGVTPERRKADALVLEALFQEVTGFQPRMWGDTMVGYGQYRYQYKSGREGTSLATGFAARKTKLSIYIMPGYEDYSAILAGLGKHKAGASCVYINKLDDVDLTVLAELIRTGLSDLNKLWPVTPT